MRRHAPRLLFCMMMAAAAFGAQEALAVAPGITTPNATTPLNLGVNTNTYMTVDTTGNVGIGVTNPSYPLTVVSPTVGQSAASFTDGTNGTLTIRFPAFNRTDLFGNSTNLTFTDQAGTIMGIYGNSVLMGTSTAVNGKLGVETPSLTASWGELINFNSYTAGSAPQYGLWVAGANIAAEFVGPVVATSTVTASAYYHSSDARLKTDIRPIDHALDKMLALKGVTFNWKKDGRGDMGMTAQNVETVFPNVVHHDDKGMMSVEYDSMVAPIIEAIRELKVMDDNLTAAQEATNHRLEMENSQLEAEIADIKKSLKKTP